MNKALYTYSMNKTLLLDKNTGVHTINIHERRCDVKVNKKNVKKEKNTLLIDNPIHIK